MADDWKKEAAEDYLAKRRSLLTRRNQHFTVIDEHRRQVVLLDEELEALDDAARVFGLPVPRLEEGDETPELFDTPGGTRPFKDFALEVLAHEYPKPIRAAELAARAERELGRKFHEKTAGMTLYRLSHDHITRRVGWDWYFIPPEDRERFRKQPKGGTDDLY